MLKHPVLDPEKVYAPIFDKGMVRNQPNPPCKAKREDERQCDGVKGKGAQNTHCMARPLSVANPLPQSTRNGTDRLILNADGRVCQIPSAQRRSPTRRERSGNALTRFDNGRLMT
jgi:hypothetical protein